MTPKSEEFVLDVRRASRDEQAPMVTTDSEFLNPKSISRVIQRAALWLTPKIVQNFDPNDFQTFPGELQDSLRRAVDEFRAFTARIPADKLATNGEFAHGLEVFHRLKAATQAIVLAEWTAAADCVAAQAQEWAAELRWEGRRVDKRLEEALLGSYVLPQVQIYAQQHLYVLDPIARFIPGAMGAFDLSIQPSFNTTSMYRAFDGAWYIHLGLEQGVKGAHREPWSKTSFARSVEELRSLL